MNEIPVILSTDATGGLRLCGPGPDSTLAPSLEPFAPPAFAAESPGNKDAADGVLQAMSGMVSAVEAQILTTGELAESTPGQNEANKCSEITSYAGEQFHISPIADSAAAGQDPRAQFNGETGPQAVFPERHDETNTRCLDADLDQPASGKTHENRMRSAKQPSDAKLDFLPGEPLKPGDGAANQKAMAMGAAFMDIHNAAPASAELLQLQGAVQHLGADHNDSETDIQLGKETAASMNRSSDVIEKAMQKLIDGPTIFVLRD